MRCQTRISHPKSVGGSVQDETPATKNRHKNVFWENVQIAVAETVAETYSKSGNNRIDFRNLLETAPEG